LNILISWAKSVNGSYLARQFITTESQLSERDICTKNIAPAIQLMKLCDNLESILHQSQKDSEMLMQAVLQEAVG
jgi:hypothetical protein